MTLPQFEQVTNYADEAGTRPLEQYQGRPRMLALLLSYVNRCQELETVAWDVIVKRMIDNAENAQLDTIGKIVGQLRGTQTDAVYRVYITARIRINRSQGHADDVIDVLQLVEAAAFTWTEGYPASALIEYSVMPSTDPGVLLALAKLAVPAGVSLWLRADPHSDGLLWGTVPLSGVVDTVHGFSTTASSSGGYTAMEF